MQITTYPAPSTYPGPTSWPGYAGYPDPAPPPSTRHSAHTARAWFVDQTGHTTDVGEVDATLNLDESLSPYGDASLETVLTPDVLDPTDPLTHRGLRLHLELRESTGDPVIVSEVTADHTGSVASLTALYGPALTPAKITTTYYTPWNSGDYRPGDAIRANLLVTGRDVDFGASRMRFTAATDEALLQAYKLVATTVETSGTLTVRGTVNYALAKVGAALTPGPADATITEPDAIVWEPGVSAWDYAANVAEAAGLVVRCDERRQWTLTERAAVRPEIVILTAFTAATERVQLDDALWADSVVVRYNWTDPVTFDSRTRYDTATLGTNLIKVITIDRDVPYPGPGSAKYWLNRMKARGRVFDFEEVGDYTLRPGMAYTSSMPETGANTGYLEAVTWNAPSDRGTIRTRGAADTIGNAIDLWPAGTKIDHLTGKIDTLIVNGA
jgi:hypothetical protein